MVKGKGRNSIRFIKKLPLFTTTNIIEGQAGLIICSSLIFYSLTIDNILNVIVMLILAGVAISVVVDGEGLFGRTRNAAKQYEEAADNENKQLARLIDEIDRYLAGVENDGDDENNSGTGNGSGSGDGSGDSGEVEESADTIAPETATIEVTNIGETTFTLVATGEDSQSGVAKYEFYINGSVEGTVETTEGTATLNVSGKDDGTAYSCYVKVYDAANNDTDSETITVTTNVANLTVGTVNTEKNQTFDKQETGTYNNPIIPKGFAPINENGAIWGSADGYQKGLVIQDEELNQYVWVPVDGTNVKFERIESGGGTNTLTKSRCTDSVPTELSQSVSDNQGFYIARFEAGTGTVSKQGVSVYNNVNWTTAKSQAEAKYPSSSSDYGVVSTLIYGTQWDTALSFIMAYGGSTDYPNFLTNSAGYGNYSSGDNISGQLAVCAATASDSNLEADEFRQKNIYDMAGNVYEWTMEVYNSARVARGGDYGHTGSDMPASSRPYASTHNTGPNIGFRVALYIKGQTES